VKVEIGERKLSEKFADLFCPFAQFERHEEVA